MKPLAGLPLKVRFVLGGAAVAVVGLIAAGLAIAAYDTQVYRTGKAQEVSIQASILAASVTAALVFDDPQAVREYVEALRANPDLDAAAVYGPGGRLVAATTRPDAAPVGADEPPPGTDFSGAFLTVSQPVTEDDEKIGTVYLRIVTEPLARRVSRYGVLLLLLFMGSLVVAILVAAQGALRRANAELSDANANLRTQIVERERAEDALRQAQKMEAVGHLTGGIAHDFNNMLAIIIGSLGLLKRRAARGETGLERYADSALEGANRAATLTQRLLAFARRQALNPQPADPNRLIAGMSELLRRSLGEAVKIETVLAGGAWKIKVDAHQLENAILNLALNSRDAMPSGSGRLTIETANVDLDERYTADHSGLIPGQYAMIAVSDTGAGMTAEVIGKAFEPFFTTKEVGKGTGLGLSQVYGFVRQSGGHVRIYSEIGHGTTVKIYLPRLFAADIAAVAAPVEIKATTDDITVLVVEDEPGVRRLTVDALSELGYRVLDAEGATPALALVRSHPEIKLLFTDIVMPEINGRELADEALKLHPDLKVLFTTGYTRNAVVHHGVLDPGVNLLGKPFSLEQLAAKLRAVLDDKT
jgi:signal transduction histidine kinase/ActR/RegA family two-component response regulator